MEYCSTIKMYKVESVKVRYINLEPDMQSEVKSEREKQILYINTHMQCVYSLDLMNLFVEKE